jgi:hypothetical protein
MNKLYIAFIILVFLPNNLVGDPIRPSNGQIINYTHVLFEWGQEPDAVQYHLQVSTDQSFNHIVFTDTSTITSFIDQGRLSWQENYYWRIRSLDNLNNLGSWSNPFIFQISSSKFQNINVTINDESLVQDGFTLFGGAFPILQSGIIDKDGNEIWNDNELGFMLTHIDQFGRVYGCSNTDAPNNNGMKINMDLDILWSAMNGEVDFHEYKQIPNGNYMGFVRSDTLGPIPSNNDMTDQFRSLGYLADDSTDEFTWYGQMLIEWDIDHNIVWSWDPFEHFTLDDFDNYGSTWNDAFINLEYDWTHANSFFFDENEGAIYISYRHLSRITKVSYPAGELIWNMGLPEPYIATGSEQICSELLFSYQHHIQRLDNGHFIFLDNGNLSQSLFGYDDPISRALEVEVIGDSICEVIWEYILPAGLFGTGSGSIQSLNNENYMIYTAGNGLGEPECTIMEVSPSQEIVWKYISQNNESWYRSYRIPSIHPEAFSVMVENYKNLEMSSGDFNGIIVEIEDPVLSFKIYNESGYDQPYKYLVSDSLGWVDDTIGIINIIAGASFEFSIDLYPDTGSIDLINITVSPVYHNDAIKTYNYLMHTSIEPLSILMDDSVPINYTFQDPYPNPFNPTVTFNFKLDQAGRVRLIIYNALGQRVSSLIDQNLNYGTHSFIWDATNTNREVQAAGVYFYRFDHAGKSDTGRLLLLK